MAQDGLILVAKGRGCGTGGMESPTASGHGEDDAAAWTIDILLYGDGVQAGNGGFFKVRLGETTIKELATVYEKVYVTKVDVTREGSMEDLEAELARLRKENGRARSIEYMWESAAVLASK
jgi:hypothetical protein